MIVQYIEDNILYMLLFYYYYMVIMNRHIGRQFFIVLILSGF